MAKLNVGDTVTMSDVAMGEYSNAPNNPHGLTGKIMAVTDYEFCYFVVWTNEEFNDYREVDLIAAPSAA